MSDSPATPRRSYRFFLELLPIAPITHGMTSDGNEQILLRRPFQIQIHDDMSGLTDTLMIEVPAVSGASLRAKLRGAALECQFRRLGIPDGSVSKDALRTLLKGGKLDGSGGGLNLADTRKLAAAFPMLTLFGAMDNNYQSTGKIKIKDVLPWCQELVGAGLLPSRYPIPGDDGALAPVWGGGIGLDGAPFPVCGPVGFGGVMRSVQYYKHDMKVSPVSRMLTTEATALIEDQQAAVKTAKATKGAAKPDKEQRREANESMPYAFQSITAGTPLLTEIRTDPLTEIEAAALMDAIYEWASTGGYLGGGAAKGHGECRVRVIGMQDVRPGLIASTGDLLPALARNGNDLDQRLQAHLEAQRETVTHFLQHNTVPGRR